MFKQHKGLQPMLFELVVGVSLFIMVGTVAAAKWEAISELPTHRQSFSTAVVDGKIYLIGGTLFEHARGVRRDPGPGIWRGPFGMSLMEVYDPETNMWQRLADMPTVRAGAKTAVVDGKIYVMGGYAGKDNQGVNFKFLKAVEMYDPQTDTWVRKQDLPIPRIQFGVGGVAGKIYAIGGLIDPKEKKLELQGRTDNGNRDEGVFIPVKQQTVTPFFALSARVKFLLYIYHDPLRGYVGTVYLTPFSTAFVSETAWRHLSSNVGKPFTQIQPHRSLSFARFCFGVLRTGYRDPQLYPNDLRVLYLQQDQTGVL